MANYNCSDNTNNTYGAGNFGTCTGQSIGAPNTGVFSQLIDSGTFTILAPLVAAIVIVCTAMVVMRWRRQGRNSS